MPRTSATGPRKVVAGAVCAAACAGMALAARADEPVDYLRQVKPLLARKCYACHGGLKQQSGLRLDTARSIRAGGHGGPAVEPGQSRASLLIEAVTGSGETARMPPQGQAEPLTSEEVDLLARWIDQGAQGPPDEQPQSDPRRHWAFQPVRRPPLPQVPQTGWVRNPIDAFVAAMHQERRLVPSEPAEPAVLLRRVYLDLVGLPPTPDELSAFLQDASDDAYERVVDQLLSSPRYGERWARHWMDVWRYSDWYGRRSVPDVWNSAPQVWRWRDWIVRSLNEDKGYDRMLVEMLAADEVAPEDDANAVATGYLVRNWYALNPNQWMKDIVEHTGKAFLGLTLNCAHCHDHKYDPISQEEYFRFRAIFEPIQVRQDWVPGEPDPGPFQKYEYTVLRKVVPIGSVRIYDENLEAKTFVYRAGDERELIEGRPPVAPGAPAFLGGDQLEIAPVALPAAAYYPGLKPFIQESLTRDHQRQCAEAALAHERAQQSLVAALASQAEIERQRLDALAGAPRTGAQSPPADPRWLDRRALAAAAVRGAQAAVELAEARRAAAAAALLALEARIDADQAQYVTKIGFESAARQASRAERFAQVQARNEQFVAARQAAEAARRGAEGLPPGAASSQAQQAEANLSAATQALQAARQALDTESSQYAPLSPVYPRQSSGRRAALARWIARRDNPLTARVAVNHIWNWHFGRALVDSTHDLGVNGRPPANQALLDWLAAELMEPAWPPAGGAHSAEGTWRMKHLHRLMVTSNTYRQTSSSTGAAAGQGAIDPENRYFWKGNARRMEAEVIRDSLLFVAGSLDQTMGGPPIENSQEPASNRRGLYFSIYPEEGGHGKLVSLFDAPDPCDCYQRGESQIPQQALALSNGPLAVNASRALARTLWAQAGRAAAPLPASAPAAHSAMRDRVLISRAFATVLGRYPTSQEQAACLDFLNQRNRGDPSGSALPAAAGLLPRAVDPPGKAAEMLILALLNHNDFITVR